MKTMRVYDFSIVLLGCLAFLFMPGRSAAVDPPGAAVNYSDLPRTSTRLRIHFIDVGPGDAILIETPTPRAKHIFIDGGKQGWAKVVKPYLEHFVGSNSIALAAVTHPDFDHIGGMKNVFESYKVLEYWDTGYDSPQLGETWRTLQTLVGEEEDCSVYSPISEYNEIGDIESIDDRDTSSEDDDVKVQFINVNGKPPYRDPESRRKFDESQRRNNASLVLKLIYGSNTVLITGDINGRDKKHFGPDHDEECDSVEKFLVDADQTHHFLQCTLLKAPHHGSNGSNSLPFLRAVNPQWVVFCSGHQYNHPDPEVLARYDKVGIADSRLLRTDRGDSTPENDTISDPMGDDCFVFEMDRNSITKIHRVYVPE